jgi:cytochrome b
LAGSLFTGFMTVNGPKNLQHTMAAIHMKGLYYLATFIILHMGGVLLAEMGPEKGMISKMVSGDK